MSRSHVAREFDHFEIKLHLPLCPSLAACVIVSLGHRSVYLFITPNIISHASIAHNKR